MYNFSDDWRAVENLNPSYKNLAGQTHRFLQLKVHTKGIMRRASLSHVGHWQLINT